MNDTTKSCPFCDNTQSYRYIVESACMRVIYPKAPACNYHVLIVPKRHVAQADMLTSQEAVEVFELLKLLANTATKKIDGFIGYNILSNNGSPAVRQHVKHAHIHVFLRTSSDKSDPLQPGDSSHPPDLTPEQLGNLDYLRSLLASKV